MAGSSVNSRTGYALLVVLPLVLSSCGSTSTTVAPSLSATCGATPASGPAPLGVNFTLDVAGAQGTISVSLNYGDGTTGTDLGARHVYTAPGSYTATLTAATPTQSTLCSVGVRVEAAATPSPPPAPSSGNQAPEADFSTVPAPDFLDLFVGTPPRTITFNMCRTTDAERDRLRFTMDFDGDGKPEVDGTTGSDCRRSHTYEKGWYWPRICVTDLGENLQILHHFQCRDYEVRLK